MTSGKHGAAAAALGYAYQTEWCLVELLRRAPDQPDMAISLELHDDVAWEQAGSPTELLQLKHKIRSSGALTDQHDDLWSTIRVWMNTGKPTDPLGPRLTLVTTATAAGASAADLLRDTSARDPGEAAKRLLAAAAASSSKGTADVRERFAGLSDVERVVFVNRIYVLDGATPVHDLEAELRRLLWSSLPPGQEETFLALLSRWWHGVALDMLRRKRNSVGVSEAKDTIREISGQFHADNLPTLVELSDVDEDVVLEVHGDRLFVAQLRWVNYASQNLRRAIVDYYRAVVQETEWLDRDLIGLAELNRFEDNLRDEWGRAFDDMIDDLGMSADEAAKVAAGKALLRKLLDSTAVTVRARYNAPFFARGKRHGLADVGDLGWHPDFQARVSGLLGVAT
jgi:hypothetical protein